MPMWNCDHVDCVASAVRGTGDCTLCNRHLCHKHLSAEYHKCPTNEDAFPAERVAEEQEIEDMLAKLNVTALSTRASKLRRNIPCSVLPLDYNRNTRSSIMGGMNIHMKIRFEDGVVWLARIRRSNATSPPPDLRDYIILSEVATLQFLERVDILTPRVMGYALEKDVDNTVQVGYILFEQLPGRSLQWYLASSEQKVKLIGQLAAISIELQKHPFDRMGSLDRPGSSHVGAFAQESMTDFRGTSMQPIGPFTSVGDYHTDYIRLILHQITLKEIYAERSVDAYLVHRFLLDLVPSLLKHEAWTDKFYLRHADDKGDHILVDEDYNITGIIDWEWAYTTTPRLAFKSPLVLFPVNDFYNGVTSIGEDEQTFANVLASKGARDLAKAVEGGRLQHFFAFCCGYDMSSDWEGFLGLFKGLRSAIGVDDDKTWTEWREAALARYSTDSGLTGLLN